VLALALILIVSFAARWPFRHLVLIRDEGEYAYTGQQILRGAIPYADVYNQKTPFVFYLMAGLQQAAGPSLEVLRTATAVYGLITTGVLYLLARRLFGPGAAFGAALAFAVMTFDQCGVIYSASTEFFMLLWVAVAVDLWYRGRAPRRPWLILLAGAAAGLAYQTKQTGMAVLAFFFLERLWYKVREAPSDTWAAACKDTALAALGFGGVFGAVLAYFALHGAARQYVECTWTNNWEYVGQRHEGLAGVFRLAGKAVTTVARWDAGLWLWGAAGLASLPFVRRSSPGSGLWLLLVLTGAAAVGAGHTYVQYYEPLIIPLSLGNGLAAAWLCGRLAEPRTGPWHRGVLAVGLLVPWIGPGFHWGDTLTWSEQQRSLPDVGFLPFVTAPEVSRYLAERTSPDEPVLVIGSEPEIYYYAGRPACTRMVITYPMISAYRYAPRLAEEFRRDFQSRRPRYVVVASFRDSLTEWPAYLQPFLQPLRQELNQNYVLDARYPAEPDQPALYLVFRRKDTAVPKTVGAKAPDRGPVILQQLPERSVADRNNRSFRGSTRPG
jgi:hypothetical protein